jgi:hypothetical protein
MSADRETHDDVTPDSSTPVDATQPLGTTEHDKQSDDERSDDTQQTLTLEDLMDTDRADSTSATSSTTDPGTRASGSAAASGAGLPPVAEVAQRRGVRVGTVVWGLVIAAVGVGLLAYASGVVFDVQLALIILIAAAGLALLAGSLMSGMRRRGR